ncbi:hypothetical protein BZG36_02993 [Bifiguratus adelaidae]|uniref:Chitobiosyldiphosphodolichol beta-mannosyltransferase n=1 Tax=Bifiguratus adelaidae TaxID=1938954 RepID=A0A261XYD1_9FUNG|nr:hypothetical protein BZG36_02993 [Bifiguratus adelaidae]
MAFMDFSNGGNFSAEGLALVVLVVWVLIGRVAKLYAFDTKNPMLRTRPQVQVVVLGDIGRSPRMQRHAVSLADAGWTAPSLRVTTNRYIRIRHVKQPKSVPEGLPKLFYLLWAPFKAVYMAAQLLYIMGIKANYPDFNPPSIPTLAIAQLICFLRKAWLVIDWHNFGYTMLGMKLGSEHPVVRWAQWYEKRFGDTAYAHITVTKTMAEELRTWPVKGKLLTFYDRPPAHFDRLSIDKIHDFLSTSTLGKSINGQIMDAATFLGDMSHPTSTLLTYKPDPAQDAMYRPSRPKLVISSTSWTEDEDFGVLLDAVQHYEDRAAASSTAYPNLLFIITGKGPQRDAYEQRISRMSLMHTRVVTTWLESREYPLLLGSADLGISLHKSSSGMDLPMKVVDMFGCGLPVCAIQFECLHELVTDGANGLIFNSASQLADQWEDLFVKHPKKLDQLRENVIFEYADDSWEKSWKSTLPDLFLD